MILESEIKLFCELYLPFLKEKVVSIFKVFSDALGKIDFGFRSIQA